MCLLLLCNVQETHSVGEYFHIYNQIKNTFWKQVFLLSEQIVLLIDYINSIILPLKKNIMKESK